MIVVLLLAAALVLGGIGFGVYLLVRPDPPADEAGGEPTEQAPPPSSEPTTEPTGEPTETGATVTSTRPPATTSTEPGPDPGDGPGPTTAPRPGGATGADPRAVARDYVEAVNARDAAAATGLTCAGDDPGTLFSITGGREVVLEDVEVLEGSVASAAVRVGDSETALLLERQEDGWCVSI